MMNPLLLEVLNIQSETYKCERMIDFVMDKCFELGCSLDYDDAGNLYVTKGESDTYPCIVSHMDTVHDILPDNQYKVMYDDEHAFAFNPLKMKMTGVGGDDKVGIYIALQMLKDLDYCKAAFFVDEEIGCRGSAIADMTFFSDVRFVLQCDRKGNKDFVYNIMGTQLYDEKFSDAILPIISQFGYEESTGGLTDVYQLAENGVGVAVANMSCGYYHPHTDEETISLSDVEHCRRMVYQIMISCTDVYSYKHSYKQYDTWWKDGGNGIAYYNTKKKDTWYDTPDWSGWEYKSGIYSKTIDAKSKTCWDCGNQYKAHEINNHGLCESCTSYHEYFNNTIL